jgi:ribosomal-protein-alanine N-acetyltransferase
MSNLSELSLSSVSVRPAVIEDFEQMATLEVQCYSEPWSLDHFAVEFEKPYSRMMVLTDDETDTLVVGYIVYWVQVEGVSLLNVTVATKWRGLGFAQKLMRVMVNETVRDEIARIVLEVRKGNTEAIRLYDKLGFKKTHERKGFYKDGETAIVMEIKTSELSTSIN